MSNDPAVAAFTEDKEGQHIRPGPFYAENLAEEQRPNSVGSRDTAIETAKLWLSPSTVLTRNHLMGDVDPVKSTIPLAAFCFMTGFMCVFSSTSGFLF